MAELCNLLLMISVWAYFTTTETVQQYCMWEIAGGAICFQILRSVLLILGFQRNGSDMAVDLSPVATADQDLRGNTVLGKQ